MHKKEKPREAVPRCSHEFVEIPTRPMIQIEMKLKVSTQSQTQQLLNAIKKHDITGAIVKIIYHLPEGASDVVDLFEIQRACVGGCASKSAQCLASINPVRKPVVHERRIGVTVSMDSMQVLDKYIESKGKDELGADPKRLKKKAFELIHEVEKNL